MSAIRTCLVASVAAAAGFCAAIAIAQPGMDGGKDMPKMDPKMMEMMEACQKAATPGAEHEWLAKAEGSWEGTCKMWMQPGMDPIESENSADFEMIMDGRYLGGHFRGNMMGQEFEGAAIYAFNNVSGKFECAWIDNMGTGIMTGTGALSSDKKVMTWTLTGYDPMTKKPFTMREVDTRISDSEQKLEMFGPDMNGKEYKMMEIVSKRQ